MKESPATMPSGFYFYSLFIFWYIASRIWPYPMAFNPQTMPYYIYGAILYAAAWGMLLKGVRRRRYETGLKRARGKPSKNHGSAAWATLKDCRLHGLLRPSATQAFMLGTFRRRALWNPAATTHTLTLAPSQTGKSVSSVIPHLLHNTQMSIFVPDIKGELTAMTAQHRRKKGQYIAIIDPYGITDDSLKALRHSYNPLQVLIDDISDPEKHIFLTSDTQELALQLLPSKSNDQNAFFTEGGRTLLKCVFLYLAVVHPEDCTLPHVWRLINNPERLEKAIDDMVACTVLNSVLRDMAFGLKNDIKHDPKLLGNFRTHAAQAIEFANPSGALAVTLAGSDNKIDLSCLKKCLSTVYVVIPPEHMNAAAPFTALLAKESIRAVSRYRSDTPVLFLLDEFTNFKISAIAETLTLLAGFGVRCHMIAQSFSEIERVYGDKIAQTILEQSETQQFFGFSSIKFAEEISKIIGNVTVKQESLSPNSERATVGHSISEGARRLCSADELMRLGKNEQLIIRRGMKVLRARRVPFWHVLPWRREAKKNPLKRGRLPHFSFHDGVWLSYGFRRKVVTHMRLPLPSFTITLWPVLRYAVPPIWTIALAGTVMFAVHIGTPHIYAGRSHKGLCRHSGLNGNIFSSPLKNGCTWFRFTPINNFGHPFVRL